MSQAAEISATLSDRKLDYQFHQLCCGANTSLWHAAIETATDGGATLRAALEKLEQYTKSCRARQLPLCRALLNCVRALLCQWGARADRLQTDLSSGVRPLAAFATDSGSGYIGQAVREFDGLWPTFDRGPAQLGDCPHQSLPEGDALYKTYLTPQAMSGVGGWMVYDVLWHLKYSRPGALKDDRDELLARERIPVLFAGQGGTVMDLVVELLPGPAGLVTPDWWPMGLTEFPEDGGAEDAGPANFIAYTQRVIRAVMRTDAVEGRLLRLRWRLEKHPTGKENPWSRSIGGRSAEAAAAVVTKAVCCEAALLLGQPKQFRGDMTGRVVPRLNPRATVTAHLPWESVSSGTIDFETPLMGVDGLDDKVRCAGAAGLEAVFAAPEHEATVRVLADDLRLRPEPSNLFLGTCEALDEVYDRLLYRSRYVHAYQDWVIRAWAKKWSGDD